MVPLELPRRIGFFRIITQLDPESGEPLPLGIQEILTRLDGLPFTRPGRYASDGEGNALCAWVEPRHGGRPRLRFGRIRRNNLPPVEDAGTISPLAIAETAGLAEMTHVVFFDDNIIGVDFNFYGPRATRLGEYLRQTCEPVAPRMSVLPLLRADVLQRLSQMDEIKLLHLQVARAYVDRVEQADAGIAAALAQTMNRTGAYEAELLLKPRKRSGESLGDGVKDLITSILGLGDYAAGLSKFKVEGIDEDGTETVLDLLGDKLLTTKMILKTDERSRGVDASSAFRAIEESFSELREEIMRAPAINVTR